ncbi:MptD family putative ECF transporter S component [Peptostreptococcus sp. D1]|uniref:MptD family putative ECF transporter S component n=1 Tax=Peptostreptococcus sp. D1 TaxID=72304 RepID=UPI0008DFA5B8|nr:MptD family putative ECF transporter S component [Peptostreptococcus sp. D1]SFE71698.1 energy-coupling factor transport system substrate-specific component [Peptostreptococcus sp. D1]
MNTNKLKIKDLVTIGVFTVIYFVVMFAVGMIGMIPILFLVYPTALGIVTGVIIMLFMAKVQKPWGLFILGMISPLIMFSMGHTYVLPVHALIIMMIAELIRKAGDYKSFKYNMISFAVFNTWICGSLMQLLLVKERYLEMCMRMMGKEFTAGLEKLVTYPNMALVYAGAIVGGVIGAYIGKAFLKKHFEKAGII